VKPVASPVKANDRVFCLDLDSPFCQNNLMNSKEKEQFESIVAASLKSQEFIRLTLGKYRGSEVGLTKLVARVVDLKSGIKLSFTYRYKNKEIVKNYAIEDAIGLIRDQFSKIFNWNTIKMATQKSPLLSHH
jgi:hypothetical protein